MGLPTITQTWTISFNNRFVFLTTSVVKDVMAAYMVSLKNFLKTTMGFTVKGSSDGTTGGMDGVDRITSVSAWQVRSALNTSAPCSWIVLTDGAGIDWLWAYYSSSDDACVLAHSQGGQYLAQSTATWIPQATDQCFDAASGTWVNSSLSLDRVWTHWATSDKKMWRSSVYRGGGLVALFRGEKFVSSLVSPATFTEAVGGGTVGAVKCYTTGWSYNNSYSVTSIGSLCRVHCAGQDINCTATEGAEAPGGGNSATNYGFLYPALQGGTGVIMVPMTLGSITGSVDGKLGNVIDLWLCLTNTTLTLGDSFGNLQFTVPTGNWVFPGDGATVLVTA